MIYLNSDISFVFYIFRSIILLYCANIEKSVVGKLPKIISNSLARFVNWAGSSKIKLDVQSTTLHEALQCKLQLIE